MNQSQAFYKLYIILITRTMLKEILGSITCCASTETYILARIQLFSMEISVQIETNLPARE